MVSIPLPLTETFLSKTYLTSNWVLGYLLYWQSQVQLTIFIFFLFHPLSVRPKHLLWKYELLLLKNSITNINNKYFVGKCFSLFIYIPIIHFPQVFDCWIFVLLFSDEGGGSSDSRSDSSEDEVTEHVTRSTPPPDMAAARAQVLLHTYVATK